MKPAGSTFITYAILLTSALVASTLMYIFSHGTSWLGFTGWTIFFVALQWPWLLADPTSRTRCTAWLARFRKGV